ncbi:MAG TPA: RpiB/LacA/LacB family sugar-phosphate isomerase [Candidatus Paceibacterota bacterium]|nr:RpiB/LacA/LacB family sugar-phosphate isomerase [Candidatus Paceibacterota bacterium]
MKIYFATDHAGFALKEILLPYVRDVLGYEVEDCGAFLYDEGDDYPEYIRIAARHVAQNPDGCRAIILGGSGQGEAMVANRHGGVRATVYYGGNQEIITLSREHNDANVLSLGARFLSPEDAKDVVRTWLSLPFSEEERHIRRIHTIDTQI